MRGCVEKIHAIGISSALDVAFRFAKTSSGYIAMGAQDISCLWDRGQADQVGSHAAEQEGRCAGAQLQTAVNCWTTKMRSSTLANEFDTPWNGIQLGSYGPW